MLMEKMNDLDYVLEVNSNKIQKTLMYLQTSDKIEDLTINSYGNVTENKKERELKSVNMQFRFNEKSYMIDFKVERIPRPLSSDKSHYKMIVNTKLSDSFNYLYNILKLENITDIGDKTKDVLKVNPEVTNEPESNIDLLASKYTKMDKSSLMVLTKNVFDICNDCLFGNSNGRLDFVIGNPIIGTGKTKMYVFNICAENLIGETSRYVVAINLRITGDDLYARTARLNFESLLLFMAQIQNRKILVNVNEDRGEVMFSYDRLGESSFTVINKERKPCNYSYSCSKSVENTLAPYTKDCRDINTISDLYIYRVLNMFIKLVEDEKINVSMIHNFSAHGDENKKDGVAISLNDNEINPNFYMSYWLEFNDNDKADVARRATVYNGAKPIVESFSVGNKEKSTDDNDEVKEDDNRTTESDSEISTKESNSSNDESISEVETEESESVTKDKYDNPRTVRLPIDAVDRLEAFLGRSLTEEELKKFEESYQSSGTC